MAWEMNACASMYDIDSSGNNIQSFRKGMMAEFFICYLLYLIIHWIATDQGYNESVFLNESQTQAEKIEGPIIIIPFDNLKAFFIKFITNHVIALGMGMLYGANTFGIIVSYLHLIGNYKINKVL